MDLDALSDAHGRDWDRLRSLATSGRMTGRGSDELIARYQAAATDLSAVSSTVGDSAVGDRLSLSISRARLRFTGAGPNPLRELSVFFGARLPAALYRIRWLTLVIVLVSIGSSVAYGAWMLQDPAILGSVVSQMGGEAAARRYADQEFVAYYSDNSDAGDGVDAHYNPGHHGHKPQPKPTRKPAYPNKPRPWKPRPTVRP